MRVRFRSERLKQSLGGFGRKYVADEDPDARMERIRRQRIEDLKVQSDLLTAMRAWEAQREKPEESENVAA